MATNFNAGTTITHYVISNAFMTLEALATTFLTLSRACSSNDFAIYLVVRSRLIGLPNLSNMLSFCGSG